MYSKAGGEAVVGSKNCGGAVGEVAATMVAVGRLLELLILIRDSHVRAALCTTRVMGSSVVKSGAGLAECSAFGVRWAVY
jgi:hypothetical protein